MPFNQSQINISSQFGMPLFGVANLPPFTGNFYWVDATYGSDGNTGGPQDPLKTLTQALSKCAAGNNDVVLYSGTITLSATLAWSKNRTHLIALGPDAKISVANVAATSGAFSPLVNVTGAGCYFRNVSTVSGIAQAATQVNWAEAGGNNVYEGCKFNQVGHATAAAQAGNRALTVASVGNTFTGCFIGGDQVVRATNANVTMTFLATAGDNAFNNCVFAMWSSIAGNQHVSAATATMSGYTTFTNCAFVNNLQGAGGTSLTAAFALNGTAGGVALLLGTTASVGATKISAAGPVYVVGPATDGATAALAAAAS